MGAVINDKEHRLKAFGISAGLYALFLAMLFFFKIFYEPMEEPLAMGVDLNYGLDLTGYGNIQTTNKASTSPNNYDVKPADKVSSKPKVTTSQKAAPLESVVRPPTKEPQAQKVTPVITSEAEKTPVVMKKTASQKTTKAVSSPAPPSPEPPKPARTVDNGSVMKKTGSGSNSNGTTGSQDGLGGNNNGDGNPGDVGDQGDPRGSPDGKSLYGNPGSGGSGGASVSISGWNRRSFVLPKDASAETGRIVFRVTVDDRGDVISIVPSQSTVSPSVTNFYRNYIQRNLGKFLSPQGTPPARSSGTITINITN